MRFTNSFFIAYSLLLFTACKNEQKDHEQQSDSTAIQQPAVSKPDFNADTAYTYIQKQLSFGPRVPGTAAQKNCAYWMQTMLKDFCDTIYIQDTKVKAGDRKLLPCINVIGSINPTAQKRILMLAHWDSRPWADEDIKDQDKPILAADDGASGVAVLLEVARQIKAQPFKDLGIDILFTDVEDYGKTEWGDESYALGTQYWASHPHVPGYTATFGILLDMVGARNARFPLEGFSSEYANIFQQQIWKAAGTAGYSSYFIFDKGSYITDDHVFVNRIIKIPTVDIINLNTNSEKSFAPHWHTHQDNLEIIDKNTLKAVGATLLQVIYEIVNTQKSA